MPYRARTVTLAVDLPELGPCDVVCSYHGGGLLPEEMDAMTILPRGAEGPLEPGPHRSMARLQAVFGGDGWPGSREFDRLFDLAVGAPAPEPGHRPVWW